MILKNLGVIPKYTAPSSWWQHVPIAHSLVELIKPEIIVELGSHYGVSFFSFCEAAEKFSPHSFVYAIDTWEGDVQAGFYGEDVYRKVNTYAEINHKQRARLLRCKFDDAVKQFKDNSIDLLHIDGLHTYEAVKHDWETWVGKVKHGGTVLLHDWNVKDPGFGVWKLWEEIKEDNRFKCIQLANGYGLGIATYTEIIPEWHSVILEHVEALKCKGLLLEEIRYKHEKLEQYRREDIEREQHIKNLELMNESKSNELRIASETIQRLQNNVLRVMRRKFCTY